MPYFGIPIRNGLPIGLGSVAGFGVQQFSPADLFSAGEQGAWYDPSDLSTLFQDSAGGTPVTAVEQPVGRMLDKSGRGNHATQSTSTSRPVLRARYNLLTYSEQFDNAAWTKAAGVSVSANTDVAPDGTLTADTVTSGANELTQGVTCVTNTVYTDNLYFKKTSGAAYQPGLYLLFTGGTTVIYAVRLNTDTGVATAVSAGGFTAPSSFNVQDVNGYWRLSISGNSSNNTTASLRLYTNLNAGGGGGAGSQIIWGAQLIVTNSLTSNAYQRIAAATDYDTSGFLPYLAFDGTDDSLLTNSVDFTATDKMTVWAGLRKLSASTGIFTELSADNAANNGSFLIGTDSGGIEYFFNSRGTTNQQVNANNAAYTSPVTNVLQMSGNISGPSVSARINAVDISTNTGSQGTGNFGNYPLYIGRRNNATFPFNGNLYSLIIRGAQSTAAQISSTETWVNGKTGAY